MKQITKIEKLGFKVIFNMGYSNGIQKITSVSAKKDNITFTATSLTKLLKQLN